MKLKISELKSSHDVGPRHRHNDFKQKWFQADFRAINVYMAAFISEKNGDLFDSSYEQTGRQHVTNMRSACLPVLDSWEPFLGNIKSAQQFQGNMVDFEHFFRLLLAINRSCRVHLSAFFANFSSTEYCQGLF